MSNGRSRFCEIRDAGLSDLDDASSRISSDPSLLDVRSGIGETVMHWLVVEDVIPAVKSLLALGAAVDSTNDFGQTPLMEAAELGYVEMCEWLLRHGADPGYLSPNDESPLCHPARSHQLETLKVLLAHFADGEDLQPYFGEVYFGIIFPRTVR